MGMFDSLTSEGLERTEDRVGGFSTLPTDIYTGKIKAAYGSVSSSGAKAVNLIMDINGREYRETIYVTNKEGKNYFITSQNHKAMLPGFSIINNICLICTNKQLGELETEEKVLNVYDFEAKAEVKKNVPVITDLTGAEIEVAIEDVIENKREKKGSDYVPTAETREYNRICNVFHPELHKTVNEAMDGKEAVFHDTWLEKNQGKKIDRRTIKEGNTPAAPKSSGSTQTPRQSLFGKK